MHIDFKCWKLKTPHPTYLCSRYLPIMSPSLSSYNWLKSFLHMHSYKPNLRVINLTTVFPHIVSAETILFWLWPYVLWPLISVHKCAETIQGRKLYEEIRYVIKGGIFSWALKEETSCQNVMVIEQWTIKIWHSQAGLRNSGGCTMGWTNFLRMILFN